MFSITGLIIAYLTYYSAYGLPDPQIVGGEDALVGKYPYQVSLKRNENHFCGGAIVSKRYVITAAHCFDCLNDRASDINIDVGSIYRSSNYFQTRYKADALICHADYNKTLHLNDIGLIKLNKDIEFNKNIRLIPLISKDRDFKGVQFVVTGWGKLSSDGPMPILLQQIVVTGFSQNDCAAKYNNITEGHICTFQGSGQGMCNGDSGGALTLNGELVGIVSYGRLPCASGNPDVFTRVYHYKSWIDKYINEDNYLSADIDNHINAGSSQQLNVLIGFLVLYLCIHLCK